MIAILVGKFHNLKDELLREIWVAFGMGKIIATFTSMQYVIALEKCQEVCQLCRNFLDAILTHLSTAKRSVRQSSQMNSVSELFAELSSISRNCNRDPLL